MTEEKDSDYPAEVPSMKTGTPYKKRMEILYLLIAQTNLKKLSIKT